jgi:hypothetical protein
MCPSTVLAFRPFSVIKRDERNSKELSLERIYHDIPRVMTTTPKTQNVSLILTLVRSSSIIIFKSLHL